MTEQSPRQGEASGTITVDLSGVQAALDRIATALELQADADPLTMLNAAMGEDWDADGDIQRTALAIGQDTRPQEPFASNGFTILYKHPEPGYEIVARKDPDADGGYTVGVEKA